MVGRQRAIALHSAFRNASRTTGSDGVCAVRVRYLGLAHGGGPGVAPAILSSGACHTTLRRSLVCERLPVVLWTHRAFSSAAGPPRDGDRGLPSPDKPDSTGDTASASTQGEVAVDKTATNTAVETVESTQPANFERKPDESIDSLLARKSRHDLQQTVGPAVERYLPAEDPDALLLPASRLTPAERIWQRVFVVLPWAVFACMLATPLVLLRANLPFLEKRAEDEREAAAERTGAATSVDVLPDFTVIPFSKMPDVLERRIPTVVLLFDPATLGSKVWVPACRDLAAAFRDAGIAVCVTALDLSASPQPPDSFLTEYPAALSPHLQLVLPRASDGEAGVVDYDGRWSAQAITEAARKLAGPRAPELPEGISERIEAGIQQLHDSLFELHFVDEVFEGPNALKSTPSPSGWRRLFGSSKDAGQGKAAKEVSSSEVLAQLEGSLDLAGGLEAACASVNAARSTLRRGIAE